MEDLLRLAKLRVAAAGHAPGGRCHNAFGLALE